MPRMVEHRPKALVAEDTELGRWAVARALEANGFEVNTASNKAEAIGRLIGNAFAVFIAAVPLERESVSELIRQVHENQPSTGLILLADHDNASRLADSCGSRAVVIEKPFGIDQIVKAACELTARARTPKLTS
jgi:DNA-binding NtrC family response regulator